MVPKFEDFFFPCLKCLSDGKIHNQTTLREYVINYFHLSQEDQNVLIKSGKKTQVFDKVQWTTSYFMQAKIVETPTRGNYRITQRGIDFLANHPNGFNKKDLCVFPEFLTYATGKPKDKNNCVVDKICIVSEKENKEVSTPTETIEEAYTQINNALADELISKVIEMPPSFFEKLVVELLVKMGYGGEFADSGIVTRPTKDDGIDGIIKEDKLGLDKILIQAKRYSPDNTVGCPAVQQFVGAITGQGASKGVFFTTSSFSKEALNYKPGSGVKLVLIDGKTLASYMIEYNVGVSVSKVYKIKRLDSDYFEE